MTCGGAATAAVATSETNSFNAMGEGGNVAADSSIHFGGVSYLISGENTPRDRALSNAAPEVAFNGRGDEFVWSERFF